MTAIIDTITNSPAAKMLIAINRAASGISGRNLLHIYSGTVPEAVVAKRRAANKRARVARRAGRRA